MLVSLPSATPKYSVLGIRSVGHVPFSASVLTLFDPFSGNLTGTTTFLLVSGPLEDSVFKQLCTHPLLVYSVICSQRQRVVQTQKLQEIVLEMTVQSLLTTQALYISKSTVSVIIRNQFLCFIYYNLALGLGETLLYLFSGVFCFVLF